MVKLYDDVLAELNQYALDIGDSNINFKDLMAGDENTDITLIDGRVVPSIAKRLKQHIVSEGGPVLTVNGENGHVKLNVINTIENLDGLVNSNKYKNGDVVNVSSSGDGGTFVYDESKKSINDGGLIINGWVRQYDGIVKPEFFGAFPNGTDLTEKYTKMINTIPENSIIKWGSGTYIGCFKSDKSLTLISEPTTFLKPTDDAVSHVIEFRVNSTNANVINTLDRGSTSVTLNGIVDVTKDSLLMVWNGYLRNNDINNPVNFETVKVLSSSVVDNNTVCILTEPMRSRQLGNTVTATVVKTPIKNITLDLNGYVQGSSANNWGRGILLFGCVDVKIPNVRTMGLKGHAVSLEMCHGVDVGDCFFKEPTSTGSGAGYGVVSFKSTNIYIRKAVGVGMRHVVDLSSTYGAYANYVEDSDAKSAIMELCHNGFCGDIGVGKVVITTSEPTYMVNTSSQGYTIDGGTSADSVKRENHPVWNIDIGDIYIKTSSSVNSNFRALSLDTEMRGNINIGSVTLEYTNVEQPNTSSPSALLYITGGGTEIKIGKLKTNCSRHIMYCRTNNGNTLKSLVTVDNMELGLTDFGIYTGGYDVIVNNYSYKNIGRKNAIEVIASGGVASFQASHIEIKTLRNLQGSVLDVNPIVVSSDVTLLSGNIGIYNAPLSSGVSLATAGSVLSMKDILQRDKYISFSTTAYASLPTITMATLPKPIFYNGQTLYMINGSPNQTGRSTIIFPLGAYQHEEISLPSGTGVRLISIGGKWRKYN